MNSINIKATLGEETRRISTAKNTNYFEFQALLTELFALSELVSKIEYQDDEKEWIRISTDLEFEEAKRISNSSGLIRIRLNSNCPKVFENIPTKSNFDFIDYVLQSVQEELPIHHGPYFCSKPIHYGIACDGCNISPITGARFKCNECEDFDFCQTCYEKSQHDKSHEFTAINVPTCPFKTTTQSTTQQTPVTTTTSTTTTNTETKLPVAETKPPVAETKPTEVKPIPEYEPPKIETPKTLNPTSVSEPKRELPKLAPIIIDSPKVESPELIKATKVEYPQVISSVNVTTNSSPKKVIIIEDSPTVPSTSVVVPATTTTVTAVTGASTVAPVSKKSDSESETNWTEQLNNLTEMGFTNLREKTQLLQRFNGDLERVINELISQNLH